MAARTVHRTYDECYSTFRDATCLHAEVSDDGRDSCMRSLTISVF
jgi:hypothetical protein